MNIPRELPQLYASGRILPFVGAGVSRSVHWTFDGQNYQGPSWRELVDQAARDLGFENPDLIRARGTDLQVLEYFKLVKEGIAPLANWCTAPGFLDTSLGYAAWRSSYSSRASSGVR